MAKPVEKALPIPVRREGRICFGIAWFISEADAKMYGLHIMQLGRTYNGGYFHGMSCGRDSTFDYVDPVLGKLYAVTE